MALDRAAATVEAQPTGDDPLIAKMLQRLQTTCDLWQQRGEEDGRRWAAEHATLDELREMGSGTTTARALYLHATAPESEDEAARTPGVPLPQTFSLGEAIERWVGEDARWADPRAAPPAPGLETPLRTANAERAAAARVEYLAYLEGWLQAVRGMWALAQKVVR